MPTLSFGWNVFKEKEKKKISHPIWTEGHGEHYVKEPSGWWDKRLLLLQPSDLNLISACFDMFYSEKKANHIKMNFYRKCIKLHVFLKAWQRPCICKGRAACYWIWENNQILSRKLISLHKKVSKQCEREILKQNTTEILKHLKINECSGVPL